MASDIYPFPRTVCACAECTACCKRQPGPLAPGDLQRIAAFLGETLEAVRRFFWRSPGALVGNRAMGRMWRIGTITPKYQDGRCVFLDEKDRCRIHAVSPAGCAIFDTHMGVAEANRRSWWLAHEQSRLLSIKPSGIRSQIAPHPGGLATK